MNSAPFAAHYQPAHATAVELEWADLPTIDFAKAFTEEGRAMLACEVANAIHEHGFFYVVNHGLSREENTRIFDVADVPFSAVSSEEKDKYLARIQQDGSLHGYKPRQYWHIEKGVKDELEIYSVHRDVARREHPVAVRPFLPEIAAFARHNHVHVLQTLLRLLARMLDLPEEALVDLHNFEGTGESYVRLMKYYPRSENDEMATDQVWLKGHTDFGSVTILWSQPVSALQVLGKDKVWRWVKHVENALVVNTGDALNFLSGARIQATIHRVVRPPPDQRGSARLGVFYFAMPDDGVRLESLVPADRDKIDNAVRKETPTMREWRQARTRAYGQTVLTRSYESSGVEEEVINGIVVNHYR